MKKQDDSGMSTLSLTQKYLSFMDYLKYINLNSLRPIISSIGSPTSRIAQYTTDFLTVFNNTQNNYYVKDYFFLSEFINNFEYS